VANNNNQDKQHKTTCTKTLQNSKTRPVALRQDSKRLDHQAQGLLSQTQNKSVNGRDPTGGILNPTA